MRPSLATSKTYALEEIKKLEVVLHGIAEIPVQMQYLIAEILLIRCASILEHFISEVAFKIVAGAMYIDGSSPLITHPCKSMTSAREAMLNHGRSRMLKGLKWTRAKFITDSIEHVIDEKDDFVKTCRNYGNVIAEIFKVRNYAAHRNRTSKTEFKEVVRMIYMRDKNMQIGYFLLSNNYVAQPNLSKYIIQSKVLIKELTKS